MSKYIEIKLEGMLYKNYPAASNNFLFMLLPGLISLLDGMSGSN